MIATSIQELKKKFLIGEAEYDSTRLESQLQKISKLCKVDAKGRVLINAKGMPQREKIRLILIARFLANKLDEKIKPAVSSTEIANMLNIADYQTRARISELVREGFATSKERGQYTVVPYRIDNFLEYAEVFLHPFKEEELI